MSERLAGRVALVSGAGGGIGSAVCRRLAEEGARVAVSDLDEASVAGLAGELDGLAVRLDVCESASVAGALELVAAELGPVEILVNNAGIDEFGPFVDSDEARWERLWQVNLRGVLMVTHAVLPMMRAAGGGTICNVASEAGRLGGHGQAVYSATKGGIIAFGKALAREEARHAINVNAVAPGPIDTALMQAAREQLGERRLEQAIRAIPAGRAGTSEEVAAAVAFLVSPDARYITGATVPVSGGLGML